MEKKILKYLLEQYLQGNATPAERDELNAWFRSFNHDEVVWPAESAEEESEVMARLLKQIASRTQPVTPVRKIRRLRITTIAASVIFLCTVVTYFTIRTRNSDGVEDVAPGYNRATITLADGKKISLDSAHSGIVVDNGIVTYHNGEQVYGIDDHTEYSILTIPKGGQYKIVLSDGTNVWLNANSTLKYPLSFSENSREVELTGEAYFEVESKPTAGYTPFIVKTAGQKVTVLGTQFNISAYEGENETKTTLVEGKVWVSTAMPPDHAREGSMHRQQEATTTLHPGQQAVLTGSNMRTLPADIPAVTAWKNGLFDFTGKNLEQVMRELARWYDIEVIFEGTIPQDKFYGKIYRNNNLSLVLSMLETTQIRYRIEGKKLIINYT